MLELHFFRGEYFGEGGIILFSLVAILSPTFSTVGHIQDVFLCTFPLNYIFLQMHHATLLLTNKSDHITDLIPFWFFSRKCMGENDLNESYQSNVLEAITNKHFFCNRRCKWTYLRKI